MVLSGEFSFDLQVGRFSIEHADVDLCLETEAEFIVFQ